jgi:hypothetical protein
MDRRACILTKCKVSKGLNKSKEVPSFEGTKLKFVENRDELLAVNVSEVDHLLGKKT